MVGMSVRSRRKRGRGNSGLFQDFASVSPEPIHMLGAKSGKTASQP